MPVAWAKPEASRRFWESLALPFAAACSEDGAAFRAYGLARGGLRALFGPAVLRRGWEAFRKGFRNGKPAGDVMMLPGTFVVDAAGRIVIAAYAAHAGDHLGASALRAALDADASGTGA